MSESNEQQSGGAFLATAEPYESKGKEITFRPLGQDEEIRLSTAIITKTLVTPTKGGNWPSRNDVISFMMLCQARKLNPYIGDAFLVGYDTNQGPKFNLITAKAAYDKRAELNESFDGIESGIVVLTKDNVIERREGAIFVPDRETLLGGWAIVYRKDRTIPTKHDVNLTAYDNGMNRWQLDKCGMIIKCAEAAALRKAFPNTLGGMHLEEAYDKERGVNEITVTDVKEDEEPDVKIEDPPTKAAKKKAAKKKAAAPIENPPFEKTPQPSSSSSSAPAFRDDSSDDERLSLIGQIETYAEDENIKVLDLEKELKKRKLLSSTGNLKTITISQAQQVIDFWQNIVESIG